jgi:hypothetical protein
MIALGPCSWRDKPDRVLHWRYDIENPVVMDSSRVAFVGAGDSVMTLDTRTGRVGSLGVVGFIPVVWRSRSRKLVCIQSWHDGKTVQFTPGEKKLEQLSGLDDGCGWAAVGGGDSILFCRSSRRWFTIEAHDLLLYDGTSGRVRLYERDVLVFGQGVYKPL